MPERDPAIGFNNRDALPNIAKHQISPEVASLAAKHNKLSLTHVMEALNDLNVNINRVEFEENFAKYLKNNMQAVLRAIPNLTGTQAEVDFYQQIIDDIEATLLPLCESSVDPLDAIEQIMDFISDGLTSDPIAITQDIANMLVSATHNTYTDTINTMGDSVFHNSFEYLNSLPERQLVNSLLQSMGLAELDRQQSNEKLLDALASLVRSQGTADLNNVGNSIMQTYGVEGAQKRDAQLDFDMIKSILEQISNQTDEDQQQPLLQKLYFKVQEFNTKWNPSPAFKWEKLTKKASEVSNVLTGDHQIMNLAEVKKITDFIDTLDDKEVKLSVKQATAALYREHAKKTMDMNGEELSEKQLDIVASISSVRYDIRDQVSALRQSVARHIDFDRLKAEKSKAEIKRIKKEMYPLSFAEVVHALALDKSLKSQSSLNTNLKNKLDKLAGGFTQEEFNSVMSKVAPAEIMEICAELNSYGTGLRSYSSTDSRKVVFASANDLADAKRFTNYAIELVEKLEVSEQIKMAKAQYGENMTRFQKLTALEQISTQRNQRLQKLITDATRGSAGDSPLLFGAEALKQRKYAISQGGRAATRTPDAKRTEPLAHTHKDSFSILSSQIHYGAKKGWRGAKQAPELAIRAGRGSWSAASWLGKTLWTGTRYTGKGLAFTAGLPFRATGALLRAPFWTFRKIKSTMGF